MDESVPPAKPAPKKSGRKPKLDSELVAAALAKSNGNISATARRFSVHRSSIQELIEKRPSLQLVLRDAREGMLDEVESALYRAAKKGEGWAVCFFLKTQGKSRGYIERQEHEHSGDGRIRVEHEHRVTLTQNDLDAVERILTPAVGGGISADGGSQPVDTTQSSSEAAAVPSLNGHS